MRRVLTGLVFALITAAGLPCLARADPIKAVVAASTAGGYARLVFDMSDFDDASVRQAGNVLIIRFKDPIEVSVDRLPLQAPDYIGAARRDPDGRAVRLALARKVTINLLPAGEKLFVDLLPESWHGAPPSLPEDVVEELARRARDAEKRAARERMKAQAQTAALVHVHVASQPTFTRYVFGVPAQVSVTSHRDKDLLTLAFGAPLKFDLGDVTAALPPTVTEVTSQAQNDSTLVQFRLRNGTDFRTFRDDDGYVVDVVDPTAKADDDAVPLSQLIEQQQASVPAMTEPPAEAGAAKTSGGEVPAAAAPSASPAPAKSQTPPATAAKPAIAAAPAHQPPNRAAPSVPVAAGHAEAGAARAAPSPATPKVAPSAKSSAGLPASAAAAPRPAVPGGASGGDKVPVELVREAENVKLSFDFMAPTAAAVFHRADTLWLVFDSKSDIELDVLKDEASHTIRSATLTRAPDADIVRIKLDRPRLTSVAADGPVWSVKIGDTVLNPSHALGLERNLIGPNRSSITIPFDRPHQLHRITDPEAGDQLLVVTGFAPARGLIHTQNFIEFRALASEQGVVIEPKADDVNAALAPDKVVISRPNGLILSSSLQSLLLGRSLTPQTFDSQLWGFDRQGSYAKREDQLIAAAAAAPKGKRLEPRLDLARFYLAREMYVEAKGVLDVVLSEQRPAVESVTALVLRAVAEIMMYRPEAALRDLANPAVGDQHEAPLWRALAYAGEGKWGQARESFKTVEASIATLPMELQRVALMDEMRAAIVVHDFAEAENELNDLETIGVPAEMRPRISVLVGRLYQGLGRAEDALAAYRAAANSSDRPAAAQGRLREILLRYSLGDLKRPDVVTKLESLTTVWRGDETEIKALQVLARLYAQDGRYRDSFYVMRSAMAAHPDWSMTHEIQEEAAKTFESLFLTGKADSMPAIDALALFYDFRDLTPIGSRGDEMIRRLADRLVSVDLLDQAASLLQYQVDKRLQGAARTQLATRLAVIYLMDRKPDRALATLQATRSANVATELHDERLLLEARALSDLGRYDFALEVIANLGGHEAMRLRSDIYWAARRWRRAAEQIELLYGDRWKQWQPLSDVERSDVLRAEIGYALAEDKLGLDRFRNKYAAKMAGTPDARAFEIVSAPLGAGGEDFKAIAHVAAAADTLDDFLRDMRARYADANPISVGPLPAAPAPSPPGSPAVPGKNGLPPAAAPPTRPVATPPADASVPPTPSPPAARPASPPAAPGRTALR